MITRIPKCQHFPCLVGKDCIWDSGRRKRTYFWWKMENSRRERTQALWGDWGCLLDASQHWKRDLSSCFTKGWTLPLCAVNCKSRLSSRGKHSQLTPGLQPPKNLIWEPSHLTLDFCGLKPPNSPRESYNGRRWKPFKSGLCLQSLYFQLNRVSLPWKHVQGTIWTHAELSIQASISALAWGCGWWESNRRKWWNYGSRDRREKNARRQKLKWGQGRETEVAMNEKVQMGLLRSA